MSRRTAHSAGFTLVEVLVAATLVGIVLWGVLTTNLQLVRSGVRITQYAEMESQVRRGMEQFGHDLKIATGISWNSSADITLTLPTNSGGSTQATYAWSATEESFYVVAGADSRVTAGRTYLVRGIPAASLTFARYDRDGNVATTDLATKRVQVSMLVTRSAGRTAAATENSVSATFTMRNKIVE
jgi:prepilin-type N-terminal cleavage/methylation domain-containing protein